MVGEHFLETGCHARQFVADTNRLGRQNQILADVALAPVTVRVRIAAMVHEAVDACARGRREGGTALKTNDMREFSMF